MPESPPSAPLPPNDPPSSRSSSQPNSQLSAPASSQPAGGLDDRHATLWQMRELMGEFVRERHWEHFHNAKNLSMSLAIEAGELMEHFQWHTTQQVVASEGLDLDGIRDELADVLCYALSLANALDIDIAQAIAQKMVKNRIKYPAP